MRKRIVILGSTGSIGHQALDVVRAHPEHFEVVGLAARVSAAALAVQAEEFCPRAICLTQCDASVFDRLFSPHHAAWPRIITGRHPSNSLPTPKMQEAALVELATLPEADAVLVATPGTVSRPAALAALEAGKDVALANKESLVTAGPLMMAAAARHGARVLPVDSEHSAIWQCLEGEQPETVRRLLLTASGGPFRSWSAGAMVAITAEQALCHPTWRMGPKVTVDSATLMNKGLEAIEAHWLFNVPLERVDVVIHPESIIHSLVEFIDGSLKAQLGWPDMRLPIQYALAYPHRLPAPDSRHSVRPFDLAAIGALHFERPDELRFPCLTLASEAGRRGGTAPAVVVAADEVAVAAFLREEIGFLDIASVVAATLEAHKDAPLVDLSQLQEAEGWARAQAAGVVRASQAGKASGQRPSPARHAAIAAAVPSSPPEQPGWR